MFSWCSCWKRYCDSPDTKLFFWRQHCFLVVLWSLFSFVHLYFLPGFFCEPRSANVCLSQGTDLCKWWREKVCLTNLARNKSSCNSLLILKESKLKRSDKIFCFRSLSFSKPATESRRQRDKFDTNKRILSAKELGNNPSSKISRHRFLFIVANKCRTTNRMGKQHRMTIYEVQHRFQHEHQENMDKIETARCTYLHTECSDIEIEVSGKLATTWSSRASQKETNKLLVHICICQRDVLSIFQMRSE